MNDTPAWWIRRKNEHDVDYSQRLRVRGRALQVRLEAYEAALERVNVLISAVPPSFRIDSDHPAAVTIRAIDLCLRELSSQEGF